MKLSILFLVLFVSTEGDWYEKRLSDIQTIDETSVTRNSRKVADGFEEITITESKLDKFRKLSSRSSSSMYTFTTNYYHEGSFLFAQNYSMTSDLLQKGVRRDMDPVGVIEQGKTIFETKKSGLKLKRSISYFKRSEIDSLSTVLSELPYDTLAFTSSEYSKVVKSYVRMKSTR